MEPIDISGLKVSGDKSGVASQGVEFETSVDFNGNGPKILYIMSSSVINQCCLISENIPVSLISKNFLRICNGVYEIKL